MDYSDSWMKASAMGTEMFRRRRDVCERIAARQKGEMPRLSGERGQELNGAQDFQRQ
jgi:hypothetical protein